MIEFVEKASAAPRKTGAYALLVVLETPILLSAGRKVTLAAPGRYVYCGSAKGPGGISARLARHLRVDKRPHWHVDRLTGAGRVLGAWLFLGGDECAVNDKLSALPVPLEGFGSSDCRRCRSHLRYWPNDVELPFPWAGSR
jgi:Uri superfamily endonuclease